MSDCTEFSKEEICTFYPSYKTEHYHHLYKKYSVLSYISGFHILSSVTSYQVETLY